MKEKLSSRSIEAVREKARAAIKKSIPENVELSCEATAENERNKNQ